MLRSLEMQEVPDGEVLISTDKPEGIHGDNFPNTRVQIRVFNSDFVKDNVFSIEEKDIPPIIILGSEDKGKRDKLNDKKISLRQAETSYYEDLEKHKGAKANLDDHCKIQGQIIKKMLEGPGEHNNYGNYNKRKYRERAEEMLDSNNMDIYLHDDGMRTKMLDLHRTTPKPEITEPTYSKYDLATLRNKVTDLLARTIVSRIINSLRDDPERAAWVRKGLGFQIKSECPFCRQQVPRSWQRELELHFSAEYESFTESLDEMTNEIDNIKESHLHELAYQEHSMIHDNLVDAYKKARIALEVYRDQVEKYLDSLAKAIKRKKERPFDTISINDMLLVPDDDPIKDLISIIHQHNDTCKNHTREVVKAGEWLECQHVAENCDEFNHLFNVTKAAEQAVQKSKKRVAVIGEEVSKLEREVSDHSRSADMFNASLRTYLGHGELQLDVRENGYVIARQGNVNPLPSEGEKTAIALLYFLTSLKKDGFNIKESIIVLDDPVSSLDASSLFAAYGFIRDHTELAGQLFILTHNFTFFREVKKWFGKKNKYAQFYMLNSVTDDQGRRSEMQRLDALLKDYVSDYHYLFACVWRGAQQPDKLESYYPLPNMARRLLEAFLAFRKPDVNGTLSDKMDKVDFDKGRKRRILAFTNAHSHNDTIAEQGHDTELLGEAPEVLSDIMELIKKEDPGHYERMVNLTDPS